MDPLVVDGRECGAGRANENEGDAEGDWRGNRGIKVVLDMLAQGDILRNDSESQEEGSDVGVGACVDEDSYNIAGNRSVTPSPAPVEDTVSIL